eukprot:5430486-Prymnesium_polylepis.1
MGISWVRKPGKLRHLSMVHACVVGVSQATEMLTPRRPDLIDLGVLQRARSARELLHVATTASCAATCASNTCDHWSAAT